MACDEGLAQRIRELLETRRDVDERRMFGGIAFMVGGHMCAGVVGDELMVRVGPDAYEACLALRHARPMDFTGRPMKGLVYVAAEGISEDEDLDAWLQRGLAFAGSLPPK
ncbi:MAG: TfoX/Sxy family protein [Myxococcota bacterium]